MMEIIFFALIAGLMVFILIEILGYRTFVHAVKQFNDSAKEIQGAFVAASMDIVGFNSRINAVENQINSITQDIVTMDIILDLFTKAANINPETLTKLLETVKSTKSE